MAKVSHLPHIRNVQSGNNKWDPQYNAIFEVYFELPPAIQSEFTEDAAYLTEQVIKVDGIDALQRTVSAGQQKFLGVDVSFLNPVPDQTYAELTIDLNLNIRDVTDNWVLKIFKAWAKLGYDLADGTRTLMVDYCCDNLRIAEANRDGSVWRSYIFHKVILTGLEGLTGLDYESKDAQKLTVKFRADYWDEDLA